MISPLAKLWRLGCLLLVVSSACDSDSDSCPDGSETCPCTVDYNCLNGLTCLSDRCVDVSWTPPAPQPDGPDDPNQTGSFDNVAACEAWLDSLGDLQCGLEAFRASVDCELYAVTPCDLDGNGLFSCFSDNLTCQAGAIDPSGLATCGALSGCE